MLYKNKKKYLDEINHLTALLIYINYIFNYIFIICNQLTPPPPPPKKK